MARVTAGETCQHSAAEVKGADEQPRGPGKGAGGNHCRKSGGPRQRPIIGSVIRKAGLARSRHQSAIRFD